MERTSENRKLENTEMRLQTNQQFNSQMNLNGDQTPETELIPLEPVNCPDLWRELFCWRKTDNRGIGVVEVILILVVLIALVVIFRDQLTGLVEKLLKNVSKNALKV